MKKKNTQMTKAQNKQMPDKKEAKSMYDGSVEYDYKNGVMKKRAGWLI